MDVPMELRRKPCYHIHEFVWAKVAGYPHWPAIIMPHDQKAPPPTDDSAYWTYFFGSHNYAWVKEKYIKPYASNVKKYTRRCSQNVLDAHKELKLNRKHLMQNPLFQMAIVQFGVKEKGNRSARPDSFEISNSTRRKMRKRDAKSDEGSVQSRSRLVYLRTKSPSLRSRSVCSEDFDEPLPQSSEEIISTPEEQITITKKNVGVFACNLYAEAVTKNLIDYGHNVIVWSTSEALCLDLKQYAKHVGSKCITFDDPRDVVKNSAIIFSMLSSREEVRRVLSSLNNGNSRDSLFFGKIYIEMTTIDHEMSYDLDNWFMTKGATYMEAMVQGTRKEAEEREMVTLIGVAKDKSKVLSEYMSCLWALGKATYFVGGVGAAVKIHETFQMIKALFLSGFVEVLALANEIIDLNVLLDIFEMSPLCSIYLRRICDNIRKKHFNNTQETIQALQQDLEQILMISNKYHVTLPLSSIANQLFKHARRVGLDSKDSSAMYLRAELAL
ncbi:uncharacterized protein [Euwallacea fornicatus]